MIQYFFFTKNHLWDEGSIYLSISNNYVSVSLTQLIKIMRIIYAMSEVRTPGTTKISKNFALYTTQNTRAQLIFQIYPYVS